MTVLRFNRVKLFSALTEEFGKLDGVQESVIALLLDFCEIRKVSDPRWIAYMLATAWHEARMRPVREGFAKSDEAARTAVAKLFKKGKIKRNYALPDAVTGQSYYGRGIVQLTHKANYEKMGARIGLDLVNNPDLALTVPNAVAILVNGMIQGAFTTRALGEFFNDSRNDAVAARRIINGLDRADDILKLHLRFLRPLQQHVIAQAPAPQKPPAPDPDPVDDDVAPPVTTDMNGKQGAAAGGTIILVAALSWAQAHWLWLVVAALTGAVLIYLLNRKGD